MSLQIHNIKFPEVYLWIFWCANKRSPFLQKRIFVFFVFFLNYAWKLGVRLIHECSLYTSFYGKSFHSLVPSYINKRLIERNSSYNLHDKHSLSIPRVQSTFVIYFLFVSAFPSEILELVDAIFWNSKGNKVFDLIWSHMST